MPKRTPDGALLWFTYTALCALADSFHWISSVSGKRRPRKYIQSTSDIDHLTDEEVLALYRTGPSLGEECGSLCRISAGTVGKGSQDFEEDAVDSSEVNALNLVMAKTTIPVPRVRRVIKREWDYLIVMDYIKGRTLAEVWKDMSLWEKVCVAFTLRGYIRQCRRHLVGSRDTPPGPISLQGPRICTSPLFGQVQPTRGPFASYPALSTWFNQRCEMAHSNKNTHTDHPSRKEHFDDSEQLVLTHQDLNPRNIIVGEDKQIWIIDWGWSGFYPPWFEYSAMLRQEDNERIGGFLHEYWQKFIPFICGPYFRQEEWLQQMSSSFCYK